MIDAIADALSAYDDGVETKDGTLGRLFLLLSEYGVDATLGCLPSEWRERFISWAQAKFDNDLPLDRFIAFDSSGTAGSGDRGHRSIVTIRQWFIANKSSHSDQR